uniref:Serine/threonine-protein kinase pim-1 n=1 Tax=Ciona savignyi TaxID=51511 RepID=H2ZC99_CIOSA
MRVAIKRISKSATTRWGWLGGKVVPLELALLCQVNEVRCSGVVDIVEWHETTEAFLLVMVRPHPAVDLYDYVSKHKRVKESLARHIIRQLITALQHCINHGVLHRDIKLENILLNPETMEITLIDFGCGDYVRSAPYKEFAGTPEYYAPEWFIHKQYYGEALTVWSIGVLFYSLICGSLPFRSAKDITEKEITKFSNDISRNARDLITCLLLKNPRDRLKLGAVLFHLFFQQERNSRDAA